MITHNHKKVFSKLDKKDLNKAQIITMPVVKVNLTNEHDTMTLEVGGDKAIVHYSRWKERMYKHQQIDKRFRQLRKDIRNSTHRNIGDELPSSFVTFLKNKILDHCWEILVG